MTNETETTPDKTTAETPGADDDTTERAPVSDDTTERNEERQSGNRGGGNVFLAVLLGGFLAGAAGYLMAYYTEFGLFQQTNAEDPIGTISESLDTQAERLAALEQAFAQPGDDPAQAEVEATLSAVNEQVVMLSERLQQIESAAPGEPLDLSPVSDRLTGLEGQLTGMQELEGQLTELQERTSQQAARIEEMSQTDRLDQLSQRIEELSATVESQAATIDEQQQAIQGAAQSAEDEANRIAVQGALAGIRAALATGSSYAEDLGALRGATDLTVPDPLAAPAEDGVPTLNQLRESFPDPAREALSASIGATAGDGIGDRFGAFLRAQTGARSLDEQLGDGADAILSRAEARLEEGDLQAALDEIATLPEAGQEALSDWMARARERLGATQAFSELNSSVTTN